MAATPPEVGRQVALDRIRVPAGCGIAIGLGRERSRVAFALA
jgi:hypothetical protein